jgi:transcriptional regulator with XRE-family HTH domain
MQTRGDRIVEAMKLRGMTKQHALANALGVNESTITRWKANGPMSVNSAILLCKELDMSLDWFLTGNGSIDSHKLNAQMPSITQDKLLAHFERLEATLSEHSKSLLIAFMDSLLPKRRDE